MTDHRCDRRALLATLVALPLAVSQLGASCTAATAISVTEMGLADAQVVLQLIQAGVAAYFAGHVDATLQVKVDDALADTLAALRVVDAALVGAKDLSAANVQAALTAFGAAFAALAALVAQIGIQVSASAPRGRATVADVDAGASGGLLVAPPILLQWKR